jgi:hypothetical protein
MHGIVNYLAFSFVGHTYPIYYSDDDGVGGFQLVTKLAFNWAFNKVKKECEGVTQGLVLEL